MGVFDLFSRRLISTRERPTSSDLNKLQEYLETGIRWAANNPFGISAGGDPVETEFINSSITLPPLGFHGGGFKVTATGGFGVRVTAGTGWATSGPNDATDIDGDSGVDWDASSQLSYPLVLSASQDFVVPAAPTAGSSRIDTIEVRADYLAGAPATVGIFNAASRVFDPTVRNKKLHWDLAGRTGTVNAPAASTAPISYVKGVAVAGGIIGASEPATTSGYVKIARINLDNNVGVATVTQDLIADMRKSFRPDGQLRVAGRVTLPGVVGGLGDPAIKINTIELPPGVTFRAGFIDNVPPSTARSYQITCYLIGGNISPYTIPSNNQRGVVVAQPSGLMRLPVVTDPTVTRVDATTRARLNGTAANWTNIGTDLDVAIGQWVVAFNLEVNHADGISALSNTEIISFNFLMGQG